MDKKIEQVAELLDYLAGKVLTPIQKCLAHYQAERLAITTETEFNFCFGNRPYDSFTSNILLSIGDMVTRDFRPGEERGLITVFPLRLRKAEQNDKIIGKVIKVWSGEQEHGGLYLEVGKF